MRGFSNEKIQSLWFAVLLRKIFDENFMEYKVRSSEMLNKVRKQFWFVNNERHRSKCDETIKIKYKEQIIGQLDKYF